LCFWADRAKVAADNLKETAATFEGPGGMTFAETGGEVEAR